MNTNLPVSRSLVWCGWPCPSFQVSAAIYEHFPDCGLFHHMKVYACPDAKNFLDAWPNLLSGTKHELETEASMLLCFQRPALRSHSCRLQHDEKEFETAMGADNTTQCSHPLYWTPLTIIQAIGCMRFASLSHCNCHWPNPRESRGAGLPWPARPRPPITIITTGMHTLWAPSNPRQRQQPPQWTVPNAFCWPKPHQPVLI